jgi:cytochrome b
MTRRSLRAIRDLCQLARVPTRKEQARNALGIIFATAMLTTVAVLLFTGFWRYCL